MKTVFKRRLDEHPNLKAASEILHADDVVSADEKPSQALAQFQKNIDGPGRKRGQGRRCQCSSQRWQYRRADGDLKAGFANHARVSIDQHWPRCYRP